MANSISLELVLHSNALNSPDASGSIKKNISRGRRQSYHGQCNLALVGIPLDAKGSPRCAAVVKFHARVYCHNCERSPTLQVESLLFVPRSLAKTLGKSVLADSRLGGLAKTEVLVFD